MQKQENITGGKRSQRESTQTDPYKLLKQGIWVYFILLIFEGALRKWILPGLASPLLLIRDPIGIAMIIFAWQRGLFPSNGYLNAMYIIGIVATFTAMFFGHGNLPVALFGARILLVHFPLIFLIGVIFNREDVIKMGKVIVWLSIPMAILIAMQFYSPQSALVNRGVGGDMSGAGFSGAMGYFRPPGTFSFTNGTTLFFSMAACFIFYFWLIPKHINKLVLLAASAGLMAAIPFSISRALLFSVVVICFFVMVAVSRKPKYLGKIIVAVVGLTIVSVFLSEADFFKTASEVFLSRFEIAAETEGGLKGTIGERYFGDMFEAVGKSGELPFFGYGIGMGTIVGAVIIGGSKAFMISEGEWGRLIGEMGALLGISVIFIRLSLSFKITLEGYKKLKTGDVLPWLLISFALLVFPQGQWAQPTALGFSTLIMGLTLASFRAAPAKPENR